jgi:hypothetical protein
LGCGGKLCGCSGAGQIPDVSGRMALYVALGAVIWRLGILMTCTILCERLHKRDAFDGGDDRRDQFYCVYRLAFSTHWLRISPHGIESCLRYR